jgi:dolichol-phosphate mannosyltransferase
MVNTPISIVIPVFEEAGNLERLHHEIESMLSDCQISEIVFVNDGSRDETASLLRQLSRHRRVVVVSHETRRGQSAALHSGVLHAACEQVVTLDGDGQNDPLDIPRLLDAVSRDAGGARGLLVVGQRNHRQDSWARRWASSVANSVRSTILGDRTPDTGCGIKSFRRDDFLNLPCFDHMHRFLPALFLRAGGRVVSIDVTHRPRQSGRSKYGVSDRIWPGIVDLLGLMWLMRRRPPPGERFDSTESKKDGGAQGK